LIFPRILKSLNVKKTRDFGQKKFDSKKGVLTTNWSGVEGAQKLTSQESGVPCREWSGVMGLQPTFWVLRMHQLANSEG